MTASPSLPVASAANSLQNKPSNQEIDTLVTLFTSGRLTEAVSLAQAMTERYPQHEFGWKALGAVYKQLGRSEDALAPMQISAAMSPYDVEAHYNLGVTLQDLERPADAQACYLRAIQIKPDYAEAHCNLGITLQNKGQLNNAEASYRRALQINPNYAQAYSNLGVVLHNSGRQEEACDCYQRALQIQPDNTEACYNLSITLKGLGHLSDAEICCRRALQIKPDYASAHYNLGNILYDLNQLDEAQSCYRQALKLKPDFTDALNNLALLLNAQGKSMMALKTINQSLQIEETVVAKSIFVDCVKRLHFTQDDQQIRASLVRALTEPWGRTSELARVSTDLIKLNPYIGECAAQATSAWPVRLSARDLFGQHGLDKLATDTLLYALLVSAPFCDVETEHFLTMARRAMLDAASEITASEGESAAALSFYSALARQCFINEYMFACTDDEMQKAIALRDSLTAALDSNTQVPVLWPVAVAAYFPLHTQPAAARLLDNQWPEEVTSVLLQQLKEPAEELQLRTTIPKLTCVENEVSLLVQSQYEENPYPRWIKTASAGKAQNIVGYLSRKYPQASFKRHCKRGSIDVLVAGCGTGQHSISTAQRIEGAQVLAVDLSISSLAYARRKTREMGLTSIEYAQADLLKLASIERRFDIIESSGVLHHLADPWAGWRVLLSLLRPDGFMKIGLYSDVARSDIVRIRALIAERGYGSTSDEIRRCRQDLMDSGTDFSNILHSPDFFSISSCRDLLFHVQEHRMTLTGIDAFLRENNLQFMGFEIESDVLRAYKQRFSDDHAATDLVQWQIFENDNPDTFANMYQFWIQKGS